MELKEKVLQLLNGVERKSSNEVETAIREIKEETNIGIILDESKSYEQEYVAKNGVLKQVNCRDDHWSSVKSLQF